MNFKDLQFSLGKLTNEAYSHLARKNPLQKQDTKTLSQWIFEERNELYVMRMLAYHHSETNKAMEAWIREECSGEKAKENKDLEDIGNKLLILLRKQTEIEEAYAAKYQQYRRAIKAIREREDRLTDIREKKRALQGRIGTLNRSNSKSPKLREFTRELKSLEKDTHDIEMEMSDFKRFALREAFYLRFNAMHEMAEKQAIIAGFGKYIVDLVDIEPTPAGEEHRRPYDKGQQAAQILADALMALETWEPAEGLERPTLAEGLATTGDESSISLPPHGEDEGGASSSSSAAAAAAGGLATTTAASSSSPAPELPPRENNSKAAEAASERAAAIGATTGDLKTGDEKDIDYDQLDLYGPPPAYTATEEDVPYSPMNSDEPPVIDPTIANKHPLAHDRPHTPVTLTDNASPAPEQQQPEDETPSAPVMETRPSQDKYLDESEEENAQQLQPPSRASSVPQHVLGLAYSQSPQPVHQELQQQQQQPSGYGSPQQQQPSMSQPAGPWRYPTGSMYSQASTAPNYYQHNYSQLYRQVSRHQRQAPPQIPYAQFQQQYQQRQRVDAGGFRIPPPPQPTSTSSSSRYPTADEEKQSLAQRYNSTQ
ncbi:hypothetical protein O0I10_009286 [Lichtheimia ornata]|uniref:Eisosome component PIL1-domain-containing protein n=1 Tax=Lichtheimia ornata TaxID=688661 RepID=A0AAD7UY72_9FUNG|nr:uncharacterized protein O0I10_009286 [Lichtheimia ornata]KAJ8655079.1 hypothetical protein O0I10_009286 [Lichtheimia ornata]